MSEGGSSRARWIALVVFLAVLTMAELAALILNYQNNIYQQQYISQNFGATLVVGTGVLVLASGLGYFVSRRLGALKVPGPRIPTFARIGSFVRKRHRLIVAFWILLLIVALPLTLQLSQVLNSSTSGPSGNSESQQAQTIISSQFPHPTANSSAIILLQGNDVTNNATKRFVLDLEKELLAPGALDSFQSVTSVYSVERSILVGAFLQSGDSYPVALSKANQTIWAGTLSTYVPPIPPPILQNFVSPNKNVMIILVDFSKSPGSFGSAKSDPVLKNVVTMRAILSLLLVTDGGPSQTYVTGDLATTADSSISSENDLGLIEPVTIGAILILTGLFFFAIVTPFIPIAVVGMALLIAEGGLYLVSKYVTPIQDTTTTFLFSIMLGVGTDYSIFLMARYREERVEGHDKADSVQTSVTWSGESIATSATTVIIAFGAMTISSFTLLRSIGVGLGFGVLIALLVSLTLIPSIILIAGDRIFWPRSGKRFESYAARAKKKRLARPGYFRRAATFSVKRPRLVLLLTLLVSIPAVYIVLTGATSYDFTAGLAQAESVHGLTVLQQNFGAGQIGPTQVVVQFPTPVLTANGNLTSASAQSLEKLSQNIASLQNVKTVTGPTRPDGVPIDATNIAKAKLTPLERMALYAAIGKDGRTVIVTVLFVEEPFTSTSLNTVQQIRSVVSSLQNTDPSIAQDTILVGGASASTLDFANDTTSQFNTMRILTVGAIFIVLLIVLGSYPLALTGIASIGLSIIWAYAATLLFFNDVLNSGVLFIIPLILFLLLYGIGMDYNIFILTRIREEAQKGKETKEAVVDAVDRTGGIITALALILAGALGSLLLSSNRLLEGFGFAIALAVILDAMLVRTYLVPAIMSVLGPRAWWGPSRLRKVTFESKTETKPTTSDKPAPETPTGKDEPKK